MDADTAIKSLTILGAAVGSISGVWSLYLQLRGKRDLYLVQLGSLYPDTTPPTYLHVVSLSEHPIRIIDYGFIEPNGRLTSIPWEAALDPHIRASTLTSDSSELSSWGDSFEAGYTRGSPIIGAYARTTTQQRPKLQFTPYSWAHQRLWTRLRVFLKGAYYLH